MFLKQLAENIRDKNILEIVQDYKTPFKVALIQVEAQNSKIMNEKKSIFASEDREYPAEKDHSESVTCYKIIFKEYVSSRQSRWKQEACTWRS